MIQELHVCVGYCKRSKRIFFSRRVARASQRVICHILYLNTNRKRACSEVFKCHRQVWAIITGIYAHVTSSGCFWVMYEWNSEHSVYICCLLISKNQHMKYRWAVLPKHYIKYHGQFSSSNHKSFPSCKHQKPPSLKNLFPLQERRMMQMHPYIMNINEDAQLSGVVKLFIQEGECVLQ